ncbi:MAG: hypothetical protein ACRERE_27155 [Candidatus Entotheonellia bacterium]
MNRRGQRRWAQEQVERERQWALQQQRDLEQQMREESWSDEERAWHQ